MNNYDNSRILIVFFTSGLSINDVTVLGGGGQRFCDNITKASVKKSLTMGGRGLGGVKNCAKFHDVIYGQPLPRTLPIFFSFPRTPFLTHLQIGALGITFIDLFETKKLGFREETTLIQTYYEKTKGDGKLIFFDFNT